MREEEEFVKNKEDSSNSSVPSVPTFEPVTSLNDVCDGQMPEGLFPARRLEPIKKIQESE